MLSNYFSYYNYKITQNIDIPILFSKKSVPEQSVRHTCQICNSVFFYLTMVFTTLSPTRTITNPWQSTAFSP